MPKMSNPWTSMCKVPGTVLSAYGPTFPIHPTSAVAHCYGLMMRKVSNGHYDSDECHSQENTGQRRKDVSAVHFELQY